MHPPAQPSGLPAFTFVPLLAALFAVALSLPARLAAQDDPASVTATMSPGTVGIGREAVYSITVLGAAEVSRFPDVISVDGLEIVFAGEQRFISARGNQRMIQLRLNYSVVAEREGTFVIPAQSVVVNGETLQTEPVSLVVREGAEATSEFDPFLKIALTKTEFYQGEVVPLEVELYVHSQTNLLRYSIPELSHPNFVVKRFERPSTRVLQLNNGVYTVYSFPSTISAIRAGSFDVGPSRLEVAVGIPQSDPRASSFFQRQVSRNFRLPSNTVTLEVMPLPSEGRPPGFTGAVGQFRLSVGARPTELRVGDPVAMDLVVSGVGSFDAVGAPELTEPDGWRLYPPSRSAEHRTSTLEPGSSVFNQVIIPERMFDAIPPFAFSYFDPATKRYVELRSDPIPLVMEDATLPAGGNAGGATIFASSTDADAGARPPTEELQDILHVLPAVPGAWAVPGPPSILRDPIFWVIQAVPLAALILLATTWMRRRSVERAIVPDPEQARTPETILRELRSSAHGSDPRSFYRLVSEFLSHPTVRPTAARRGNEIAELWRRADSAAYGGRVDAAASSQAGDEDRRAAIRTLESLVPAS